MSEEEAHNIIYISLFLCALKSEVSPTHDDILLKYPVIHGDRIHTVIVRV